PVRDEVEADLAARALHAAVDLARLWSQRQRDLVLVRPAGDLLHRLLDDPDRLLHFFHLDHEAVVDVAHGAHGHVEVEAVVHAVWLRLAEVPRNARATQ